MITFNIELNSRPDKEGLHSILIRITENRQHRRVGTGYSIEKVHWGNGKIKDSHPNCKELNLLIRKKIQELENSLLKSQLHDRVVNINDLQKVIQERSDDFHGYFFSYLLRLREKKFTTWKRMKSVHTNLKTFRPHLKFQELTLTLLKDYETFMYTKGNSPHTISSNMKGIRTVFNEGCEELELLLVSPFSRYKAPICRVNREKLTLEEIQMLELVDLKPLSLSDNVRNMFLFAFYNHGMRVTDVLILTWDNIKGDTLDYTMSKTLTRKQILMVEQGREILDLYPRDTHYIFPLLSHNPQQSSEVFRSQIEAKTALMNKYLKMIAEKAGITKTLTTHISRHSFSDIAIEQGVDLRTVSEMLGHTNVQITQAYIGKTKSGLVNEAMKKMFKKD